MADCMHDYKTPSKFAPYKFKLRFKSTIFVSNLFCEYFIFVIEIPDTPHQTTHTNIKLSIMMRKFQFGGHFFYSLSELSVPM
jgi:hypothetical protein